MLNSSQILILIVNDHNFAVIITILVIVVIIIIIIVIIVIIIVIVIIIIKSPFEAGLVNHLKWNLDFISSTDIKGQQTKLFT